MSKDSFAASPLFAQTWLHSANPQTLNSYTLIKSPCWSKGKSYLFSQRRKWGTPDVTCPQAGSSWAHSGAVISSLLLLALCVTVFFSLFLFSLTTARVCRLAEISWWLIVLSLKISTCCYRSCVSRGFHYPYPPSLNMFSSARCKFDSSKPCFLYIYSEVSSNERRKFIRKERQKFYLCLKKTACDSDLYSSVWEDTRWIPDMAGKRDSQPC